jgi:hypothetical protein
MARRETSNIGFRAERTAFDKIEEAAATAWFDEMKNDPYLLDKALGSPGNEKHTVTGRDAKVAATLIQWLTGTNVGTAMLQRILEKTGYTLTKKNPT